MSKTKAEIEAENEDLKKQLEQLQAINEQQQALLSAIADEEGGGWIITTPNVRYNEVTAGIQFRMGKAFIPDGKNPEKAEFTATMLKQDYGYSVEHVDPEQLLEMKASEPEELPQDNEPVSEDLLDMYAPGEMLGDDEF